MGRWVRKGAVVGELLSISGVFLTLLALLALIGAVEIHVDVIGSLVSSGLNLATSLPGLLPF